VDNGGNGGNWQSTNASLTYNNGITCNCNVTGADWQVATANTWTVNRNYAVIFRVPNGYSVSTSVAHSMRILLLENSASSSNYIYFDDAYLAKGPIAFRAALRAACGQRQRRKRHGVFESQRAGECERNEPECVERGWAIFWALPANCAESDRAVEHGANRTHVRSGPSGSTTPVSFFDNSGNLFSRNDLNAVSALGAATVSMSNASDGPGDSPRSGTTSGKCTQGDGTRIVRHDQRVHFLRG